MESLQMAINIALTIKELEPFINDQTNVYKVEKCSKSSTDIRNEGNKLFNLRRHDRKIHIQTLMCYTKCIAYAPSGSEELAKGYGNRSMLLYHLGEYESCITDIDRALSITQSSLLRIKLLLRKVDCLIMGNGNKRSSDISTIQMLQKVKDLIGKLDGNEDKLTDDFHIKINIVQKMVEDLFAKQADPGKKVESRKAIFPDFASKGEIPGASDALALSYNTEFGRHLTANREIKAGEILMIEDGFVYPNIPNAYMTCSHCVEGTYNGIPCDTCVFAIYCSEKCKQDAWTSYHDKECTKYDYYKILKPCMESTTNNFDKFVIYLMLLRRILIFTIKKTGRNSVHNLYSKFFHRLYAGKNEDKRTKGFKINDRLDGHTLEAFGSLTSHMDEKIALIQYLPFVCMLGIDILPMESNVLSDVSEMLRIVTQAVPTFLVNTFAIGLEDGPCVCKTDQYGAEHQGDCINRRGAMLAPFCSLINHSCVNNASHSILNGKMVLFSNRPIKPGEQIFIHYGAKFPDSTKSERQTLSLRYHFTCNCEACRENWPALTEKEPELYKTGFSECVKNLKEFNKREILSKTVEDMNKKFRGYKFDAEKVLLDVGVDLIQNEKGLKVDRGDSKLVEFDYLFSLNKRLYAASKTIHSLFGKNSLRTFIIKSTFVRYELSSSILKEIFRYDKNHFNVSDKCSNK